VGIARAIVTSPRLIVLDEPTASLDLSIRGQILDTLREAQQRLGVSYLLISHDMATINRLAHRTLVLYHGCVVESGPAELLTRDPAHPYTIALMSAVLPADPRQKPGELRLAAPTGGEAAPRSTGCVLRGRCPEEVPDCTGRDVVLVPCRDGRGLACVGRPGRSVALADADPGAADGTARGSPGDGAQAATGNLPKPQPGAALC
jgi:oligopeptide/dipeptide ABC transporter ATP-binding protein